MFSNMSEKNLYCSYEFEIAELEDLAPESRQNSFFELIYILDGRGRQWVNGNEFDFKPGNLFLLTPQDVYSFEVGEPSRFVFVRFNDAFVRTERARQFDNGDRAYRMEFILENASHRPGCILRNQTDKPVVRELVESVIREKQAEQLFHERVIEQTISTLITIVARNIALRLPDHLKTATDRMIRDLLFYIHRNIYEPDKLKTEGMAREFGIGAGYVSRYFKKHTGETIARYIANYKMKLVETRLLHSDWRISQIAYELNFTDESHLNKVFKKHFGENPSEYRRKKRAEAYKPGSSSLRPPSSMR
jgi:AraC-like DNA-binding protein